MTNNNALISVLIRTKDRPILLNRAVESVLSQTYRPVELIVVNDGGIEVKSAVEKLIENSDISFKYKDLCLSKGRSAAANTAIEMSNGDYLLFLDDDDWIAPEHLSGLYSALKDNPDKIGAYSDVESVEKNGGEYKTVYVYSEDFDKLKIINENFLPIHSVLFKRKAISDGCRFDENLTIYEDWNFWLQVINLGDLIHVSQRTAFYHIDESGVGLPGTNKDFTSDYIKFIKSSIKFLNNEQLVHLFKSVKLLDNCQNLLTDKSKEFDELLIKYEQQKEHLEKYDKLLTDKTIDNDKKTILIKQLESHIENYQNEIDKAYNEVKNINQKLDLTTQQLEMTSHRLRMIESSKTYKYLCQIRKIKLVTINTINFFKPKNIFQKFKTLARLIIQGDFKKITRKLSHKKTLIKEQIQQIDNKILDLSKGVGILATKHTYFIGKLIETDLKALGFDNIYFRLEEPEQYEDMLYFVVCPQMFDKLPGMYISFQMEQSVSSRWFTEEYFSILENSFAIMDYSISNIEYLLSKNLHYKQIFWVPISNANDFKRLDKNTPKEYDVVFYGDINNKRRKRILDKISEKYSVLILSEVFGDELYNQLNRAKVLVNIHYYENALLETTRLYESLSLGLQIVSETSSDIHEHSFLEDYIYFCEIGNVDEILLAIKIAIENPKPRPVPNDMVNFKYYFRRMLLAMNLIPYGRIAECESNIKSYNQRMISLTLPETVDRFKYFKQKYPDINMFHGLRHKEGWMGCALSYKFLCEKAMAENLDYITLCEDDVIFPDDFDTKFKSIKNSLFNELKGKWDIFSGLIADLSDHANVLEVIEIDGIKYVIVDKMTSTVFNIYSKKAMDIMSKWDPYNTDVDSNTIDRYLENNISLKIVTTLPFLVGHQPELTSTLWHFQNDTYDELIIKSQKKLEKKVNEFLENKNL